MTQRIFIRKILGDGLDLETGNATKQSVVLSNGVAEVVVPVDKDFVLAVLRLYAVEVKAPPPPPQAQVIPLQQPEAKRPVDPSNPYGQVADSPGNDDFDPGEMYEDSDTGTSSV